MNQEVDPVASELQNYPVISWKNLPEVLGIFDRLLDRLSGESGFVGSELKTNYCMLTNEQMDRFGKDWAGFNRMTSTSMPNLGDDRGWEFQKSNQSQEPYFEIFLREGMRRPRVLSTLAHELGHCLHPYFSKMELEELKALLFQQIVYRQAEKTEYQEEMATFERISAKRYSLMPEVPEKSAYQIMQRSFDKFSKDYVPLLGKNIWIQLFNILTKGKTAESFRPYDIGTSPPLSIEELIR